MEHRASCMPDIQYATELYPNPIKNISNIHLQNNVISIPTLTVSFLLVFWTCNRNI